MDSRLINALAHSGSFTTEESYKYLSIFLSKIQPDETNPRLVPTIIMSDVHAYQLISKKITKRQLIALYNAKGKVIIGKSCIVNCCERDSIAWKNSNKTIESILELAENTAVTEIIQAPTIYCLESGGYKVLTGHRRFFSMIYNNGLDGAAHFKVYDTKPILFKTKQYQENASREDLSQYGKLLAFQDALLELDKLNETKKMLGQKELTVKQKANFLGISMGAFDNFNVLTRYPAVINSFESDKGVSFIDTKKLVLKTEKKYKLENDVQTLSINDKKKINNILEAYFDPDKKKTSLVKLKKVAPPPQKHYKIGDIGSRSVVETILKKNVCEIDCGVNWESVNWDNPNEINDSLKTLITFLTNELEGNSN